ncbi:MAG TPA: TA system VapC family ribonuclease toxin [Candidatus Dormibacteraeota bacterium]|nr:TA system VapC family ribonuclease toxin [Candidatus Dormibacteraeota bacterium]
MRKSSRLFLFPDINVWVALTYDRHVHHLSAREWFEALAPTSRLFFCRITQLGLLRLLSEPAVMGSDQAKSQPDAWNAYDRWLEDERVDFLDEPSGLETQFRVLTRSPHASPKDWADSYLAAFALASRLTIVTFDRAFQNKAKDFLLLQA